MKNRKYLKMIKYILIATLLFLANPVSAKKVYFNSEEVFKDADSLLDASKKLEENERQSKDLDLTKTEFQETHLFSDGPQYEYFENGKIRSEKNYAHGQIASEKQYYESGQVRLIYNYKNDLIDGEGSLFYETGELWNTVQYFQGKRLDENGNPQEGLVSLKRKNGVIAYEVNYLHGLKEGEGKAYDEDGKLRSAEFYIQGKMNGLQKVFYPNGHLYSEINYKDDQLNGVLKSYDLDGKLMGQGNYVKDKLEGESFEFYKNGQVRVKYIYANGKQNGLVQAFYENGKLAGEFMMKEDQSDGLSKEYYSNGNLKAEVIYSKGVPDWEHSKSYYEDGSFKPRGVILDQDNNVLLLAFLWMVAFIISTTFHEASHAYTALKLGDDTAYQGGQVSLNPLPHIKREPLGMVVVPLISFFAGGWMIGWASAPYNLQWSLKHPKRSAAMSVAGPLANLFLLAVSALLIKAGHAAKLFVEPEMLLNSTVTVAINSGALAIVAAFLSIMFSLNLILFIFNLIPLPPLDGAGVLTFFMPHKMAEKYSLITKHPRLSLLGLFIAWKVMDFTIRPIFIASVNLLYPGANYGG